LNSDDTVSRTPSLNPQTFLFAACLGILNLGPCLFAQSGNVSGDYQSIKATLRQFREESSLKYSNENGNGKDSLMAQCQKRLFDVLTEKIFPAWYGTRWGFYGSTRAPGKGEIACGCFVVFTLQDVGFRISSKMADQPSENIIKNLVSEKDIVRFAGSVPMAKVVDWIKLHGEGLYIVGLDIHVGFIINKNSVISFCHSSYYNPPLCVVNQHVMEESPLTDSKYRVIGQILQKDMVKKWAEKDTFPIRYDYFRR
jgi:hypothetical protein